MVKTAQTAYVGKPPAQVWRALNDVAGWPQWAVSPQMERLEILDPQPFGLGSRFRVKPKGLAPSAVYEVMEYDPPRSFTWTTRLGPGGRAIGRGEVQPEGGGSKVTLSARLEGPVAFLLSPILARMIRRHTEKMTSAFMKFCEARPPFSS